MEEASSAHAEDGCRNGSLDAGHEAEESAAQSKGLHGFRLEHTAKELPGPPMADLFWLKPQGAIKKTLFEEPARTNGNHSARPGLQHPQRNQGQQDESLGQEPAAVKTAVDSRPPYDPP